MSARFRARRQLVNRIVAKFAAWAEQQPDVQAAIVVGSYAYGRPRMGSDVDLVVLTDETQAHLRSLDFIAAACPDGRLVRSEQWVPMNERRVRLPSGLYVEFGITASTWASLPLDEGTARVLSDGCKVLVDRGLIAPALASIGRATPSWNATV
ncbi:Nucleotidyltransferase domain-containing protein [Austwickia chelonae]|uniref:Polymerase beta nucleotidyltransferase domain-containing protein n=1 Tax=Austwickia chelonae NBRC 105200 TaxID=1184607 RepID=K6V9L1_9MICO|nr:nucleotidyltransferase domain-containing protein [Austwickia chelonae]GAB78918.1 hypothetical protein AUCHE_17_01320 [Austwickia chelonae NBRC 105200]SEV86551.1 Nucleotidyltransferase domain-containing protein [Austwickia chelonae]